MKKSQLKNIIRESIKELMTEQYTPGQTGILVTATTCQGSFHSQGCHPDPNTQVGDTFHGSITGQTRNWFVTNTMGSCIWQSNPMTDWPIGITAGTINNIGTCQNCCDPWYNDMNGGVATGHCHNICQQVPGCTDPNATNYDPNATVDDGSCVLPLPPCSNPQSQCDYTQWSGAFNWYNNWTSLPNFTSTNPNQPCAHICNKIQQWTNACQNAGPVQANQLACKLSAGIYHYGQENCSTSNAPACQGLTI